jgi:hypothetical protein
MEYVEVYHCGNGTGQHPVYMATDEFAIRVSLSHAVLLSPRSKRRQQHQERAERNEIYYNWVSGGFYGEIELIGPDPHGTRT